VLEARLQDAEFSFRKDLEAGLEALDARLDAIVFHKRLGTMAGKRDRLVAGVGEIAGRVGAPEADRAVAERAAALAKADQGAVLVAEFSELEGYVAAEYARRAGVPEEVALAVEEHFLPEGPDSPTPSSEAGALVAAAERVDNLTGAFAVDEAPTGSKDPYGLRRAALGLVRIALDRGWDLEVGPLVEAAHARLAEQGADLALSAAETRAAVEDFMDDRVVYVLGQEGVGAEAAAAAIGAGLPGLTSTAAWARAIQQARSDPGFMAAWTASTRLSRLARRAPDDAVPAAPGDDPGEAALRDAVEAAAPAIAGAREAGDFGAALAPAAGLAEAVDRFFVDVLVNAEDPGVRARRYALVRETAEAFALVADFDRITDGGGGR
jgi:glycyl-tRNA synthetase beta chain